MKSLLCLLALFGLTSVGAQTCDLTLTTEVAYKGQPVGRSSVVYLGLDQASVDYINRQGMNVVKAGAKVQDKGGGYSLTLGESHVCGDKTTTTPSISFEGLKPSGLTSVFRAAQKESEALMKASEDQERKGKSRVWGKP
jgi:hypothetical protein